MTPKTLGTLGILEVVFGGISALASVVVAIDQIKNADKRAALSGYAAGQATVEVTASKKHRTPGGNIA